MTTQFYLARLALLFLFALSQFANAQHQSAHVHGLATLTMALENTILEIELESPAANLLGFEHAAKTSAETQRIEQMKSLLNAPEQLFSFTGSVCEITEVSLDTAQLVGSQPIHSHEAHRHDEPEAHNHADDAHHNHVHHTDTHQQHNDNESEHSHAQTAHNRDKHKHDDHHEHEHNHDHANKNTSHNDINAYYRFSCKNASAITSISTSLFKHFSGINKINAAWASTAGQGAATLNADSSTITLK